MGKKVVAEKAQLEEKHILEKEEEEAKQVAKQVAEELESGMQKPMEEEKKAESVQEAAAQRVLEVRHEGHKHEERVIMSEAEREEREAESQTEKQARLLRVFARKDILATEKKIISEASKASKVAQAAKHWLEDQEVPAVNKFIKDEKAKLKTQLSNIETEARYKTLKLQKKLGEA